MANKIFTHNLLKRKSKKAQEELGNLFSIVDETLKSSKIIKIFNADIILNARFEKTTQNWKNHAIAMSRRRELASPSSEFLGSVTILLITWFAGIQILEKQTMDAVTFIGFIAIFFQILEPAKRLSAAISNMQGGIPAVQRVLEVLDYDLKVEEIDNPIEISTLNDRIEFKNVDFTYDGEHQILKKSQQRLLPCHHQLLEGLLPNFPSRCPSCQCHQKSHPDFQKSFHCHNFWCGHFVSNK